MKNLLPMRGHSTREVKQKKNENNLLLRIFIAALALAHAAHSSTI